MDDIKSFQNNPRIRSEARKWLVVFNRDEPPSKAEIAAMQAWVKRSPMHQLELERAQKFWRDTDRLSELAVPACAACKSSGRARISQFFMSVFPFRGFSSAFAAALTVVTIALVFSVYQGIGSVGNGVYGTAVGELRLLTLEDQSTIQLDTNSQVQVSYSEGLRYIRLLQGKAYFDVAKNKQRPFEVHAGGGLVRAVGTAFSVYLDDQAVEVLVGEGRVDLARMDSAAAELIPGQAQPDAGREQARGEVFLSADKGHQVLFSQNDQISTHLADKELSQALSWREGALIFAGESLEDVVAEVSRYTPVSIKIADPKLSALLVGGRFNIGDIEALFDVLESGFGVQAIRLSENNYLLRENVE